jgi:AAA+ superfamily predicted ATPase
LLSIKLKGLRREFEIDKADFIGQLKGMSHADVERVLRRAAKEMVLTGKEFLNERLIQSAIRREDTRKARLKRS